MTALDCPEHGNLVRDLLLGRLDDQRGEEAEAVLRDCAVCARWWNEVLSGKVYDAVDEAVADVISSFAPPARRRYRWLAAVAILMLAVGIGTTSLLWRGDETSREPASEVLSTWDFEPGTLDGTIAVAGELTDSSDKVTSKATVFAGDFESGDLSGWSTDS